MGKIYFVLFSSLLCLSFVINTSDLLYWDSHKLNWTDFKIVQNSNTEYGASSNTGVKFEILNLYKDSAVIQFLVTFNKNKSWVSKPSDYLLNHEQRHFDIEEINARKLKRDIKNIIFSKDSLSSQISKYVKKYRLNINEKMHDIYDIETDHSVNEKMQIRWNQKIDSELISLNRYSKRIVTLLLKSSNLNSPKNIPPTK